jgi:hypothetical protein
LPDDPRCAGGRCVHAGMIHTGIVQPRVKP